MSMFHILALISVTAARVARAAAVTTTNSALILEHQWAKFRDLPQFTIHRDPLRKNLLKQEHNKEPSTFYYYKIEPHIRSCVNETAPQSVVCVECSTPSRCEGHDSNHCSLLLNNCEVSSHTLESKIIAPAA